MADNYLDALLKQSGTQKNMKGVPVDVETDIGKPKELNPQLEALVRRKLSNMDPKSINQLKRKLSNAFPDMEENKRNINKSFNKRAGEIQDRTKQEEALKRKVMSANKKKEIKDTEQIAKDEASAKSKADKKKESKDKIYLDFTEVTNVRKLADNAINQLKGDKALEYEELRQEYATYDKAGNQLPLDDDAKAKISQAMQKYDAQIRTAEVKRDAEEKQKANKLIFDALQKHGGNMTIEEIGQLFAREGLGDYYVDFVNNLQQMSK